MLTAIDPKFCHVPAVMSTRQLAISVPVPLPPSKTPALEKLLLTWRVPPPNRYWPPLWKGTPTRSWRTSCRR
jgi:hypothetical protein